jgi:hypothetical protein
MDLLKIGLAVVFASFLVWKLLGHGRLRHYLRRVQGKA